MKELLIHGEPIRCFTLNDDGTRVLGGKLYVGDTESGESIVWFIPDKKKDDK